MSIIEGVKDFLVGIIAIILGVILTIILILLWPFIAVIGWFVIMLILIAAAIPVTVILIMIIGKLIRGSGNRGKGR